MKILSRDFTKKEKIMLLILSIILLVLCYYQFIDRPVRTTVSNARVQMMDLETQMQLIDTKIAALEQMKAEIDSVSTAEHVSYMGSYNNHKAEVKLLNDILTSAEQYQISFANVTREGDQIRRDVSFSFTTADYETARAILQKLADSEQRCLIGELRAVTSDKESKTITQGAVSVAGTATFYETMVGGTPDAGLPAETEQQENE